MQKKNQVATSKWVDLLVFVLFVNVFFFHSFGTVALWMLLLGLWILLIRVFEVKLSEPSWVRWGGSGVIALAILTYVNVNSPEKVALLVLTTLSTMVVCTYIWLKRDRMGGILELALSGLLVVRAYLRGALQILRAVIVGNMRQTLALDQVKIQSSPWTRSLMVGGLVALPLVAWLVLTLSKADPVFATFVKVLLSEDFLKELPWRLFFSLLAFLALIPLLMMHLNEYVSPLGWLARVRWGREMAVVTGMVALVLGIFLAVQWPYVFANVAKETELIKYGVATYSEYVTKGFWDLLKVVVMVFGVAWVGLILNKNQKGTEKQILLGVQGVLGLEFAVFIVSIFRRVWLYQSYHGLSLARLYGLALLIALVGMVVTMTLRYVSTKVRWVKVEMVWLLTVVFGAIWINMESLVVANPPTVNGRVDYVYLSRLSGDGYAGWKTAYEAVSSKMQEIESAQLPGIGVDHRREVLYGSLVLGRLSQNYDSLIWRYGSDEEVKEYLRTVIDWEEKMLRNYPEIATSRVTGGRVQVQGVIDEARGMIGSNDWDKTGLVVWNEPRNYGPTYTFSGYDVRFYGLQKSGLEQSRRLAKLDSMLSHSWQDEQLYRQMRTGIPIEGLLQAIENYWNIRLQIITQPETERVVEIDISLDSPFLR